MINDVDDECYDLYLIVLHCIEHAPEEGKFNAKERLCTIFFSVFLRNKTFCNRVPLSEIMDDIMKIPIYCCKHHPLRL